MICTVISKLVQDKANSELLKLKNTQDDSVQLKA